MSPIGGYFGSEECVGGIAPQWIKNAISVQSGRMALLYELQNRNPGTIWLPCYYCDAVPLLLNRLGYDLKFYGLTERYRAELPSEIACNDVIVLVDYFGLTSQSVQMDISRFGPNNVIVDACMSLWIHLESNVPTFFSPRKFFGIPDGGYLTNPSKSVLLDVADSSFSEARAKHLKLRKIGKLEEGRKEFLSSEKTFFFEDEPKVMSKLTRHLISNIDFNKAYTKRRENFSHLKNNLAEFEIILSEIPEFTAPLCLPVPHENSVYIRENLAKRGIFCAHYWPNMTILEGDLKGKQLSDHTIFLPIDHRYSECDMDYITLELKRLL